MSEVSVVVAGYERPDACARAVRSALDQTAPPREVLIADDGSSERTLERLRALERDDPRVRVLPADLNTGSPGAGRNRGVRAATGEWIALLDDDDRWRPEKLARQTERAAAGDVDLVATGALRSSGESYFPANRGEQRPAREDLLRDNPLITSSVLVRRDALLRAGLFPESRRMRGVEDYAMWLALADHGVRMAVLDEPLVLYADADDARLSAAPLRQQVAVARLFWRRCLAAPRDAASWRAAAARTAAAARLGLERAPRG